MMRFFAFLAALAIVACPSPTAPTQHDAADGAHPPTPEDACANLAALGCLEGADALCVPTMAKVVDAGLTKIDLACIAHAQTKDAARTCPSVTCP